MSPPQFVTNLKDDAPSDRLVSSMNGRRLPEAQNNIMKMGARFLFCFVATILVVPVMFAAAPCFPAHGRVTQRDAFATFVWTGEHYLALWFETSETGTTLFTRRVAENGRLIDEVPHFAASYPSTHFQLSASYTDGVVLVASHEYLDGLNSNVVIRRLNVDGVAIGEELVIQNAAAPIVGASAGRFMVAYSPYVIRHWTADDLWRDDEVVAVRITPAGAIIDSKPIVIATGQLIQQVVDVDFIDDTWIIAWSERQPIFCGTMPCFGPGPSLRLTRVTNGRVVLDYGGLPIAPEAYSPSVDCNAEVCLVAWNTLNGIAGSWIDAGGEASPTFRLSAAQVTLGSSTVWSGERFVVTWLYAFTDGTSSFAFVAPRAFAPEQTVTIARSNFHGYSLSRGPAGFAIASTLNEYTIISSCTRPRGIARPH
jgi:hypothetical protein